MNMYDEAYSLSKAIKESDEMKRLVKASEEVKKDPEAKKMVKEYMMAQMKADYAKMAGQKQDEQEFQHLQDLAVLISNNETAQNYVQAFIQWNQIAADLQKIISEAMSQGLDVLDLDKK
jgi:cell fate (sporulation/competence/biofilm development) regulator YlbF (YheA/YmcA/DUF963 family)